MIPTHTDTTHSAPALTRRNFVAGLAALGGATLASTPATRTLRKASAEQLDALNLDGGEWRTAGCWMTCHCGCINKAYVVDGLVVRQKTDDSHPDTADFPQQRSCVKGHSLRQLVCGADRLRYPMKRKHWEPGGTGDNSLRGRDVWERISWDEALDYIADEFTRIRSTYGDLSIASPSLAPVSILSASGGYTSIWGQQSQGGWALVGNTVNGSYGKGNSDRLSLRKAKLIVLWGLNPIYSLGGSNTHYLRQAKDAGAKVIVVDPWFSPSCQSLADEWVPVRPGTDGALLAAIAYTMIENGWQDQDKAASSARASGSSPLISPRMASRIVGYDRSRRLHTAEMVATSPAPCFFAVLPSQKTARMETWLVLSKKDIDHSMMLDMRARGSSSRSRSRSEAKGRSSANSSPAQIVPPSRQLSWLNSIGQRVTFLTAT